MEITELPKIFAREIHEGRWDIQDIPEILEDSIRIELNIIKMEEGDIE